MENHLSRMSQIEETKEKHPIKDAFADERILAITSVPWFAEFAKYLVGGVIPNDFDSNKRKKFVHDCRSFLWYDPLLYKKGVDRLVLKCVPEGEQREILKACHNSEYGGHFNGDSTTTKVLKFGLCWSTLFKDAHFII